MSKFWQALFYASIIITSVSITTFFIIPQVIYADENSTCTKNQFYYLGKCYANDTRSFLASMCGMHGTKCASMPCPHGYTFAANYTNGILTGFQCANLSNCPYGTVSHDNACVAIEIGQHEPSPFKQIKNGILSHDVICKDGFVLIKKLSTNSLACVKPQTAQKLVKRGWGTTTQNTQNNSTSMLSTFNLLHNEGKNGTLSGYVVLADGPAPVGPKTHYEVDLYATDGVTIVAKILSNSHAHYSIQLPAGNYIIYAPDYPTKQTHLVSVFSGKNTIFNIVYGSGYK